MTPRSLIALSTLLVSSLCLAQIPADITLEPAFGGSSFASPIAVRHAGDGSDRKFVVQREGEILIVDGNNDVLATPFLDISALTSTSSERGLLGLAFHPDFAENGLIYINYTDNEPGNDIPTGDTIIAEYQVSGADPNLIDPLSRRQIIVIPQDFANHNGGDVHFGADGYLYIGMGDGGSGNDPCNRGLTLDPSTSTSCRTEDAAWLLGKMVRIDVDNTTPAGSNNLCAADPDGSAEYAIPGDNPFVGQSDRCGEVWAYGLRNPYRFSVDRETGDLWIGDVGQGTWEEIDHLPFGNSSGANLGWKICEGNFLRGSTTQTCTVGDHVPPVITYPYSPSPCRSVTGGYRYRGPVISMQDYYVYSDYCSGQIFFASEDAPGSWTSELFDTIAPGGFGNHAGYGEDEAGNLYLVRLTGDIRIFQGDTAPGDPVFQDRFEEDAP